MRYPDQTLSYKLVMKVLKLLFQNIGPLNFHNPYPMHCKQISWEYTIQHKNVLEGTHVMPLTISRLLCAAMSLYNTLHTKSPGRYWIKWYCIIVYLQSISLSIKGLLLCCFCFNNNSIRRSAFFVFHWVPTCYNETHAKYKIRERSKLPKMYLYLFRTYCCNDKAHQFMLFGGSNYPKK